MIKFKVLGVPAPLLLSIAALFFVAAFSVGGTLAYFSSTKDVTSTLSTARIGVGFTSGVPLSYATMLPGETVSHQVKVQNTGNRTADLYVQLKDENNSNPNLCTTPWPDGKSRDTTYVTITGENYWAKEDICKLFPGWSGSVILKVADDVPANGEVVRNIAITLPANLPNLFADKSISNTLHIIAVQSDAPAPTANTSGNGLLWSAY